MRIMKAMVASHRAPPHLAVDGATATRPPCAAAAMPPPQVSLRHQQIQRYQSGQLEPLWLTVAGCRMHALASTVSRTGRRPPVVLVHGFGVSCTYFEPTAARLVLDFDVYAPDLPGHGKSDTPAAPLNIPELADALVAWMDCVGLRRASLVGNSMGCQIAVDAAMRYPDRVDGLVLIGPTVDPAGRSVPQLMLRLLLAAVGERLSLGWILFVDYVRMHWRLLAELRFMLSDRIEDKLPQVKAPVMLVRGEYDAIAPRRWIDEMAAGLGADQIAEISGCGHAANYSAAEQLTAAISPFLRQVSEGSLDSGR